MEILEIYICISIPLLKIIGTTPLNNLQNFVQDTLRATRSSPSAEDKTLSTELHPSCEILLRPAA